MSAASPNLVPSNRSHPARPHPHPAPVFSLATGQEMDPVVAARRRQDQELVREILDGKAEAFTRLYELTAQRIHRFAVKRLGDPIEAEDVVQDTFLEVHRCLGSWQGRSSLLSWMFGIAHHQLCRRFRKKLPFAAPIEELEAALPVVPGVSNEQRLDAARELAVCAEALDEDVSDSQREIFDLHYGAQRSIRQIAEELEKSNQAVKISLFRTRRAMEARLERSHLRQSA